MIKPSFKAKIALVFFAAYTLLSLYLIGLFYHKAVTVQQERLRQHLMQISVLGTELVDVSLVENTPADPSNMGSGNYDKIVGQLKKIMAVDEDIADVYILVSASRPGMMKFLANADDEERIECGEDFDVTPFPELLKGFDGPAADKEITRDKWGYWLSGYAPLTGRGGEAAGILGIDVSAETIGHMVGVIRKNAVMVFLVGVIFSVAAGNIASWWLTKPLNVLVGGMNEISSGNLEYKIPIKSSDEIGRASQRFNSMAVELKRYMDELTEMTREKERLKRDLEIAAELQQSMLPVAELDIDDVDLSGLSLPALQVGGDYFDYIDRDGKNIGFVIADASGKGLPGSIFMTNSRSIFKVMATEEVSPAKVMQRTNELVIKEVNAAGAMFVTMFYGIYDRSEKIFRYSNAGHNPPMFVDNTSSVVSFLGPHGTPVGVMEEQEYGESRIQMRAGDMIVLYTDGVIEAMNKNREMFGTDRLRNLVLRHKDLPAREIMQKIRDSVFAFSGDEAQFDDLTLLIFKVR